MTTWPVVGHAGPDVSRVARRVLTAFILGAVFAVSGAGSTLGQAAPSDSGGADRGESASAWHDVLAFLGWILLAVVVFGLLLWMVLGRRREGADPDVVEAAASSPAPVAPRPAQGSTPPPVAPRRRGQEARELAVLTFDHIEGAERAYADARGRASDVSWLREIAFVECHRHGRIVVRGTFAGHYLDVDDVADAIGHDTAVGAGAGAVVGLALGPPGFALGPAPRGTPRGGHQAPAPAPPRGRGPLRENPP